MANGADTGLTEILATRALATSYDSLPTRVRELVRQCTLDYFAVAIAGADDPLVSILLEEMTEAGGVPEAAIVGHNTRLPALSAALINGAMAHALDYDDLNMSVPGHPSIVVLAATLAMAEGRKSSGRDLMSAFVAGYETACRIGVSVQPDHFGKGFHATGTVCCFGAAGAAAHLLGLDADTTRQALGLAGSQAAGLKSQNASMCKPLHAGKAAQNGLLAARLARRGFSSRPDMLECEQGFGRTYSADFSPGAAIAEPKDGYHLFDNLFKFHASGYFSHASIECMRQLRREHGVSPDQVAAISIRVDRGVDRVCNIPNPATGRECKFSLRQNAVMALAGVDTASVAAYSLEAARDPLLGRLRNLTAVELADGWPSTLAEVELRLVDGRQLSMRHDAGIPTDDLAAQGERLKAKFDALVSPVLGARAARALSENIQALDDLEDVGELMRLTTPA